MAWTAFLDACVLYPFATRDLLLRGSEASLYQVRWSPEVLEEARRNLVEDQRIPQEKADSLISIIDDAFPDASVTGYEQLATAMTIHAGDRHVLAAAIIAKVDVLVTDNVRHFPSSACEPFGIDVQTADEFLSFSFDLAPDLMGAVFLQQVEECDKPALDACAALTKLDSRLPYLADRLRTLPDVRSAAGLPQT